MSMRPRTGVSQHPSRSSAKNIVVFGEGGVGKSSLINLIAGRSIAATSSSAKGCTFQHKKHEIQLNDTPYAIWDTTALDEGTYGTVPAEIAEENLKRLLHDLGRAQGIHLLVYCVRATRLRQTLLSNYNLFYSAICRKKVPIVAVITGLENHEPEMADWWTANETEFAMLKMHFDGHACVTTLNADKVNSPVLKQRCLASRSAVLDLITSTCARDLWGTEHDGWVSAALADARVMFRPTRRDSTPLPPPIVALHDLPDRPRDPILPAAKDAPPFEPGRLMDVGGSPLLVYHIRDRQLGAGVRFKRQIAPRGADLLILCTSCRTSASAARQCAAAFYGSYGGETRPLLIVVRDAPSEQAATEWWNAPDDGDTDKDGDGDEHGQVHPHQLHHGQPHYNAGKVQAIVRALPPPGSADVRAAVDKLQRTIQTRALQPLDTVPTGCFGWLRCGRRSAKVSSGNGHAGVAEEDTLTKSMVWVPWRAR